MDKTQTFIIEVLASKIKICTGISVQARWINKALLHNTSIHNNVSTNRPIKGATFQMTPIKPTRGTPINMAVACRFHITTFTCCITRPNTTDNKHPHDNFQLQPKKNSKEYKPIGPGSAQRRIPGQESFKGLGPNLLYYSPEYYRQQSQPGIYRGMRLPSQKDGSKTSPKSKRKTDF